MPAVPFYRGSAASTSQVMPPRPGPSLLQTLAEGAGNAMGPLAGGLIHRAFYKPENDPRAQQANLYAEQAAAAKADAARKAQGAAAQADLGNKISIASSFDNHPLPQAPGAPPLDPEKTHRATMGAIMGAYEGALGQGADPAIAKQMVGSIAAQFGATRPEDVITLMNAVDGKYMKTAGGSDALTMGDRNGLIEDQQQADADIQRGHDEKDKFGFNVKAKTELGVAGIQASTSRANNSQNNATARRGQDLTHTPVPTTTTVTTQDFDKVDPQPASGGFFGIGAHPAVPGQPKTRTATKTTGVAGAFAAPPAGPAPAAPQGRAASGGASAEQTKILGGKTYVKRGGQWYEQ